MATYTLAQYAQDEKSPLKKGVFLGLAREGIIADIMSWRSTDGALSEEGVRYDEVISPDWIPLDGTISSKTANGHPLSYGVYEMAVHIDIPEALETANARKVERASVQQNKLAIAGAAYVLNDTFVNGSQATDPNQFEGVNRLVATMAAAQTVGSAEVDLTGTYSDAVAESLFARLDSAIYQIQGHKPTAMFANDTFLLKLESYSRQYKMRGNDFNWMDRAVSVGDVREKLQTKATQPAFMYKGIPIYDIGLKADQSTRIIGNTYAEGGSAAATRIFLVKLGEDDVEGLQFSPLDIRDIGILEAKNVIRKRLTWRVGLAAWGPQSIVKVAGIKVA